MTNVANGTFVLPKRGERQVFGGRNAPVTQMHRCIRAGGGRLQFAATAGRPDLSPIRTTCQTATSLNGSQSLRWHDLLPRCVNSRSHSFWGNVSALDVSALDERS